MARPKQDSLPTTSLRTRNDCSARHCDSNSDLLFAIGCVDPQIHCAQPFSWWSSGLRCVLLLRLCTSALYVHSSIGKHERFIVWYDSKFGLGRGMLSGYARELSCSRGDGARSVAHASMAGREDAGRSELTNCSSAPRLTDAEGWSGPPNKIKARSQVNNLSVYRCLRVPATPHARPRSSQRTAATASTGATLPPAQRLSRASAHQHQPHM